MDYSFQEIEKKWQQLWQAQQTFAASNTSKDPKCYILDMFPYPSGAGLHVGHPLGYIASDIYARYKRHTGFNVLHPMGYDAFGLPAEQYAIQTGQHPDVTTKANINRYRAQLDQLGFSFDWSREVRTCSPDYYKWTQWIFIQLFESWYDTNQAKAMPVAALITHFESNGTKDLHAACAEELVFSADDWQSYSSAQKSTVLLNYRLAYLSESMVNWCPALGTVLANDEVKDGRSERGGYPVEQKQMLQWSLRISAYAQRLLDGLDTIDWRESLKESQRNWIGRSEGAAVLFKTEHPELDIEVFTTRPDTLFGATFLVIAPEHDYVSRFTSATQENAIADYQKAAAARTERERLADAKTISGCFTGSYALHPFTGEKMPIWISDYVLAGYGTGAVMAVPAHDTRDFAFAKHFGLPIVEVVAGGDITKEAYVEKEGTLINSAFLNGLAIKDAQKRIVAALEEKNQGAARINYRIRDAVFGRQRYWGEPIPVYYKDGIPHGIDPKHLPLELPEVSAYLPTETGEPPLARAEKWHYNPETGDVGMEQPGYFPLETTTMPGWAGSSWYFLRYMDPQNTSAFVDQVAEKYWQQVDVYIGGSEHATGHLLYARFWQKMLFDRGLVSVDEPFKKLINQGMIGGVSALVHRVKDEKKFVSSELADRYETTRIHIDIAFVNDTVVDVDAVKAWREEFASYSFEQAGEHFHCVREAEKMSKGKFNVVNPDQVVAKYGADTLRMYEMFLGPLEQHKPWSTEGISGVYNFLRKFWRLYHQNGVFGVSDDQPSPEMLKVLHKTIKKVTEDINSFSFNTSVSAFMICVNQLAELTCRHRAILEPLTVLLSPFAPHIAEELWEKLGHSNGISKQPFPSFDEKHLVEHVFEYPISFNGKMRFKLQLPLGLTPQEIEQAVLADERTKQQLIDKTLRKTIVVPGKIVNLVVG